MAGPTAYRGRQGEEEPGAVLLHPRILHVVRHGGQHGGQRGLGQQVVVLLGGGDAPQHRDGSGDHLGDAGNKRVVDKQWT